MNNRIYTNAGNTQLLDLLDAGCRNILDVGCGAGDNAALISARYPNCKVFGITHSIAEAERARQYMEKCWVFDIERDESDWPNELKNMVFDTLIFSHVLEHLREPSVALAHFSKLLVYGGVVLIAVPNILNWRQRIQFIFGKFEYELSGVLDDTHLRFFTYFTADHYLITKSNDLKLTFKSATGSVPLWWLRRYVFPKTWSDRIDTFGCKYYPNLFGWQILIKAIKNKPFY